MGTMPICWNDATATNADKTRLLTAIRARQGPGMERIVSALRTPRGRPVS